MESASGTGSPSCKTAALRQALRKSISASCWRPAAAASLPARIKDATSLALAVPGLACSVSRPSPSPAFGSTGDISQLPDTAATKAVLAGTGAAPILRVVGELAYGP